MNLKNNISKRSHWLKVSIHSPAQKQIMMMMRTAVTITFIKHLIYARHDSKYFLYINSFHVHCNPLRSGLSLK